MATPVNSGIVFSAKTATFTSAGINIEPYINITLQFLCESHTSGNGVFTVDGSNDGINWTTGLAILDVTQTTLGTAVASITLSSNTSASAYVLNCGFKMIRVKVTFTTDGSYSAFICARQNFN